MVIMNGIGSKFNDEAIDIPNGINKAALALLVRKFVIRATNKNKTDKIIPGLELSKN